MHILIEGESYPEDLLQSLFEDPKFYRLNGLEGTVTSVGYYHSFSKNRLVFMLPKVFMKEGDHTVLGTTKDELIDLIRAESVKHRTEYNWVRQLSVYFYNSLLEYRKRSVETSIINESETFQLNTNIGAKEYSFLDILLSFVNYYKKNKQQIYLNILNLFLVRPAGPNGKRLSENPSRLSLTEILRYIQKSPIKKR